MKKCAQPTTDHVDVVSTCVPAQKRCTESEHKGCGSTSAKHTIDVIFKAGAQLTIQVQRLICVKGCRHDREDTAVHRRPRRGKATDTYTSSCSNRKHFEEKDFIFYPRCSDASRVSGSSRRRTPTVLSSLLLYLSISRRCITIRLYGDNTKQACYAKLCKTAEAATVGKLNCFAGNYWSDSLCGRGG